MPAISDLPKYNDFQWPGLQALRSLGGSATNQEMNSQVIDDLGFSEDQQALLHKNGPMTAIEYRLHWARTYLKGMGLATNSSRGVWELTEKGRLVTEGQIPELRREYLREHKKRREQAQAVSQTAVEVTADDDFEESDEETGWQDQLLEHVLDLSPQAFEELSRWLLRVEGFVETKITGKSHDGGIDGQGLYQISLLTFQVFFQCKRYRDSVGSSAVRDFRGAMAGRGDKGLLITTGSFTSAARKEARRDGAPPIDLIDGAQLCELLKKHRRGVRVNERVVEDIEVAPSDFEIFA